MYNDRIEDLSFSASLYPLEEETDLQALRRRDSYIESKISDAKGMIRRMEAYRQEIFEQAQQIAAAPVSLEIELVRQRRFSGSCQYRPFYYLTCYEVYAGIGKKKKRQEIFPRAAASRLLQQRQSRYTGKDRFKAIKLLDEWKKQFPAATITVDIKKSKWER